ncbi:hypothetical protein QCA50_001705 [Cerrena zonata]|uniref:Uncharacterized protein n=1 Tax=Cerrena zonata TaxID=2478898 RepID=A0AAW0GTZ8_9APHY
MAIRTEAIISASPDSGSETESEDGNFDDTQVAQTYEDFAQSQLVHPAASDIPNCPSIEKVHPEETHNLIIQASNAITAFLDVLLDSRIVLMDEFRAHLINGLASLCMYEFTLGLAFLLMFSAVRYDFMEKLFVFRILFHQIAASEMPQGHSSVVVCWVDVILAKLSHAILAVMGQLL